MKQLKTQALVLRRINYGEVDRILSLLTADYGKISVIAKGVRRSKSKLAGGIELFSESAITFIQGKSDISTLISTRLVRHFNYVVKDIDRTSFAYQMLKIIQKSVEDRGGEEYYPLLMTTFTALNDPKLPLNVAQLWFYMHLLRLSGHAPNLQVDHQGQPLSVKNTYEFDLDRMRFLSLSTGIFEVNHIKLLRLSQRFTRPQLLQHVNGLEGLLPATQNLAQSMVAHTFGV